MANTRRDFLRTSACALGGMALASSLDTFGVVHALTPQAATDYRALVCVFLNGGNDGNNMFLDLNQYSQYSTTRNAAQLAIAQASFLPVAPVSGGSFGFHPNMPEMQSLFNQGKLAVLCNNGPLVEPLTRTTYQNGTGKKPLQLFSHSDQVGLYQTAIANSVSQTGWGGRLADKTLGLNGAATFPSNVSIAGVNLYLTGIDTRQLAVADSNTSLANVLQLNNAPSATASEISSRLASFNELRSFDNNFKLIKAASDIRSSSIQTDNALSNVNPVLTTVFPNTSISRQLLQVARLIKASTDPTAGINMKRQIFFVQIGGFDTHSAQLNGQGTLLQQLSQAINAFFNATIELGLQDKVTLFTMSDFSRTLQPSGTGSAQVGSDHAWGNHQMIVGGAVQGHTLYGTYPNITPGGPDDTDGGSAPRGRWIPTTSIEQYAATLASWYGLSSADLTAVFPLIGHFATANLGFLA
ncbi:MAG TPA: DUF1501 domain-containing protein [Pyrinomonadaceae bacterium]|nr:DUF1501 domain-containing protein [Pyrinomonadaceae bacterium]